MTARLISSVKRQPIALLALFVALGGSSYAAVNRGATSDEVIHACVGDNTGRLRVVDGPKRCGSLETPLSFNREGREGERGERGRTGAKGDDGARGAAGPAGAKGDAGPAGAKGDTGDAGPAGPAGAAGPAGQSVAAAVEAPGANCASGGVRFTSSSGTHYACNGGAQSAADVLAALQTVDGAGSGLDADTLDGADASEYLRADAFVPTFDARFPVALAGQLGNVFGSSAFTAAFNGAFPNQFDARIQRLFGGGGTSSMNPPSGLDCTLAEVRLTAAGYPPPGTMFAAGQTLLIAQWQTLFALLGTTYGGDGHTTFRVPDLRDHAPGGVNYTICHTGVWPVRQ